MIGKGAPTKAGTADAHGAALGDKEIAATRAAIGWTPPAFEIPARVYAGFDAHASGAVHVRDWQARFATYKDAFPALAAEFERRTAGALPPDFASVIDAFVAQQAAKAETIATRKASQQAIGAYAARLPEMLGGADLTGSVFTNWSGSTTVTRDAPGNYVYFGVREFGMAAIANGVALHGGFIPYHGTFLTFSDYMRNAVRMAALMKLRVVAVFTHDSIGLGEDGPTHQSVEHTASLRLIPQLDVWRPCDAVERRSRGRRLARGRPSALMFTRQNVPFVPRDGRRRRSAAAATCSPTFPPAPGKRAVVIADGLRWRWLSRAMRRQGRRRAKVVSMPCTQIFDRQDAAYRASVLPRGIARVAIEAGATDGWRKYVGAADDPHAAVVGLDRFGESAPGGVLFKHFGFTVDHVTAVVRSVAA